jgi:FHA domain-containing protein
MRARGPPGWRDSRECLAGGSRETVDGEDRRHLKIAVAAEAWRWSGEAVLSFQGVLIGEYPVDRPVLTIGRQADNDIVIDHMAVSGQHARVMADGQLVVLADMQSTNGTFVNGRRVEQADLRPNDWITIGKHILILKANSR